MAADDLVTVYTTNDLAHAQLVVNELRDEGIAAFVEGGNQGGFAGIGALAVNVQVKASDADRATAFVRKYDRAEQE
jgi:hypothetical protein